MGGMAGRSKLSCRQTCPSPWKPARAGLYFSRSKNMVVHCLASPRCSLCQSNAEAGNMDLYTQIRAQAGITTEMLSTFTSLELAGWEGALVCSSSLHLLSSSYFLNFALYCFYDLCLFCLPPFPQIVNAKHGE